MILNIIIIDLIYNIIGTEKKAKEWTKNIFLIDCSD